MQNNRSLNYKPEIDGIRAIAVISVLLFHLDFKFIKNGFLGVDIFFVISGYLISKILLKNYKNKNFLISFFLKRIRRLLPALLFVMILTLVFCLIFFLPNDLRDFGQSLVAIISISSNFLFFIEDDYFANASKVKPLLHSWSLSVEEQFYIIFAVLFYFIFCKKIFSKNIFLFLFIISILGSHFSGLLFNDSNNIVSKNLMLNQSIFFGFFSPLGRLWEFLLGSLIVIYRLPKIKKYIKNHNITKNFLSFIGILLIFLTLFNNQKIISPSLEILSCLFGTILIILFGKKKDTIVGNVLSQPYLVFLGKISYSIYLIHFPIIVLLKYQNIEIQLIEKTFLIISITLISYLNWKYIEQPFRNEKNICNKNFFSFISIPILFLITLGFTLHFTNGLETRFVDKLNFDEKKQYYKIKELFKSENKNIYQNIKYPCKQWSSQIDNNFEKKFFNCAKQHKKAIIILGDSHALDVYNSISKTVDEEFIIGIGKVGCRIFDNKKCDYKIYKNFIQKNKSKIKYVLFVHAGRPFHNEGRFFKLKKEELIKTENYLNSFDDEINMVWFGFNVEPGVKPIYLIKENGLERFENMKIYDLENILKKRKNQKYKYFSRIDLMDYSYKKNYSVKGKITFSDSDHWSNFGELYFGKIIFKSSAFARLVGYDD